MNPDSLKLLKDLAGTASPSGYEMGIQQIVRSRMSKYCHDVTTDVHGNVIGVVNPEAGFKIMLTGHCDEIGFLVTHIDDKGFIYIATVGGIDVGVLQGQHVIIQNRKAPVIGVIGRRPIHLSRGDGDKTPKIHELWVDIGAKNRKDAEKAVAVGDYAIVDAGFEKLRNNLIAARGLDDRAGVFIVLETLRKLNDMKCEVGVYAVSTVQEEIGLRGARTSAYGIDPQAGIAVDVWFASDCPGSDAKVSGQCILGKGPIISRGPHVNPVLGGMIESVAGKKKIPFQPAAQISMANTDANALQINRAGSASATVSIACRYIHTPIEVISLDDVDNTSRLLAEFLAQLKPGTDFIPRAKGR